jgi:acyl carrier protein
MEEVSVMNKTEFIKNIREFMIEELAPNDGTKEIGDDESLLESGILDSLGIMKLLTFMEEKYQIKISEVELLPENFETLSSIARLVLEKQ